MTQHLEKSVTLTAKKFREFFLPTVLASLATQLAVVVDGIIVGNFVSAAAMTGISVCMPLTQMSGGIVFLLAGGSAGMIAVAAGSGRKDDANRIYSTVMLLAVLMAPLYLAVILGNLPFWIQFLAGEGEVAAFTGQYLRFLPWHISLLTVLLAFFIMIRADGKAKLVSRSTVLMVAVNLTLDVCFVGVLGLGVAGSAIATIIGDVAAILYVAGKYFTSQEKNLCLVNVLHAPKAFCQKTREILVAGVPIASGVGLISIKVWCIYRILDMTGGAEAMTLYAVCMACLTVASLIMAGCQGAMVPVLGLLYGEKDYWGVRLLLRYVLKFSFSMTALLVLLFVLFPQQVLALFNVPLSLYPEGCRAIRLFAVSLLMVPSTFLLIYYYTTIGQPRTANILSVTEGLLAIVPPAYFFAKLWGLTGIWLAFILAELCGFAVLFVYLRIRRAGDRSLDMLLLPEKDSELLYDVGLQADKQTAVLASAEVMAVLQKAGLPSDIAVKTAIAVEEMTVNIATRSLGQPYDLDVRIRKAGEHVLISLRDNGVPFNPLEYTPEEQDRQAYKTDGIILLKVLAKDIRYNRVLSLNQTTVEI